MGLSGAAAQVVPGPLRFAFSDRDRVRFRGDLPLLSRPDVAIRGMGAARPRAEHHGRASPGPVWRPRMTLELHLASRQLLRQLRNTLSEARCTDQLLTVN